MAYQCVKKSIRLLLFLFCFSSVPISTSSSGLFKVLSLSAFPRCLLFLSMETAGDTVRLILPSYGWNGLHATLVEAVGLQLTFVLTSPVILKMQKLLIFKLWLS